MLRELGRIPEAEKCFRRLLQIDPRDMDAIVHLGALLRERSQFGLAADLYRAALRQKPVDPFLWMLLGVASRENKVYEESARALRKAVELKPDYAEAHYQLGLTLRREGKADEALAAYTKAVALDDGLSGAHNDIGDLLQDEGRLDEAVAHYRAAIRTAPDYAAAYSNLGCALTRHNELDEAAKAFAQALRIAPDFADAHYNLGSLHSLRGAREEALRCYERALELRPRDASIRDSVLREKQHLCDWRGIDELIAAQLRAVAEEPEHGIVPFSLLSIPSTRAEQLKCARRFAEKRSASVARERARLAFRFAPGPRPRLRIGYLSADFHEHATAHWMAELFELHDRSRFEIVSYSYGPDEPSPMRARLKAAFDRFVDIAELPHSEAAQRIHADGVDILVDLKGYTTFSRPAISALRPAPVQASFVGYPATMGAEYIDYLIADHFVTPPEHADDYSEKLVRLPGCYQVNDRKRAIGDTPPRAALGLPENAFVFCCFNQTYKILPAMFATWMRILSAVPMSVLWLLQSNAKAADNLRAQAHAHGIDPARIVFAPLLPLKDHLGRIRAADLLLDTLPYNAHTIASDALWAGLPVLTCPGETFVARVAASQLSAVGLPELIAATPAEYESRAVALATQQRSELSGLRARLAANRDRARLFDTPWFARNLEEAYQKMWQTYSSGATPAAIDL